ncbi:tetratricopeptide repeat protein [Flavilitoribacter nigricans]|nr:tetratricopeptide repeat protein [Flavilitoribacter nigricans]
MTLPLLGLNNWAFAQVDNAQTLMNDILIQETIDLREAYPDSAIYLFELYHERFLAEGDTLRAIEVLIRLAGANGHRANYKTSYDKLWKALFLADQIGDDEAKVRVYINLGRYYSFYKRREEALRYLYLSLDVNKELIQRGTVSRENLIKSYYALCATYRELSEPELGKLYLDSCLTVMPAGKRYINEHFLEFERAFLVKGEGDYRRALQIYQSIQPWFAAHSPAYQVLLFTYTGDTYVGLNNYPEAEKYYQRALEISEEYHSHIDFTPLIYERLSNLYVNRNDFRQAYESLRQMKDLDERFFDSRSENNRPLLEIQDAFREQQEQTQQLLREQRLTELEHRNRVWFLQRAILLVCLLFLLIIGFLYFNYVRSKHRAEKRLIRKEREMEVQKANELLELKNKELAASTLKLIEKDEFLASIKDKLAEKKEGLSADDVRRTVRSIKLSSTKNWEEFEARFVAVNQGFYECLNERFPKLTQGDQRLCALIKLNFSSKDMAKLMGISVESVHTTRYRLRKKLKLARAVNLEEFIAGL